MHREMEDLLDAALIHVPFEGMNDAALRAGAADIGIEPAMAAVHFPQGGAGLAAAYHRRADAQLRDWLAETPAEGRLRDRIADAVWHRLGLVDPELVRAAAATLALPQHASLGSRLVWESADIIWDGLGDQAQDANWYTKRASLSAVIGATVLFWIGDESPQREDSRDFLDRRIGDVMRIESLKAGLRRLPGATRLGNLAFGWIHPPRPRNLPGNIRHR